MACHHFPQPPGVPTVAVTHVEKNGHIRNGKHYHQCHCCTRQFVQCFEPYRISHDKRALIERVLVEWISLRGMCRVVGVKLRWL